MRENGVVCPGFIQGAIHALKPKDFRCEFSFPVSMTVWTWPKLFALEYWRNEMQILSRDSFDLYTSGVHQSSTLVYA